MSSYIESVLMRDEDIIFGARLHWIIYFWPLVITLAGWSLCFYGFDAIYARYTPYHLPAPILPMLRYIYLGVVSLGVVLMVFAYIRQQTTELAVTNRRVLA